MSCKVYSVIPSVDNNWIVTCGPDKYGPYLSNDIALRVAIAEAMEIHRHGLSAMVTVQDESGRSCAGYCICAAFERAGVGRL